jgi:positive regulator of sigma E activity
VTVFCMNMVVPIQAAVPLAPGDWVKVGANGTADKAADKATACARCWSTTSAGQDAVIKLGTSL